MLASKTLLKAHPFLRIQSQSRGTKGWRVRSRQINHWGAAEGLRVINWLFFGACLLVTGCTTSANKASESASKVAAATPIERCEILKDIIQSHPNGFESLKGKLVSTIRLNIWQANFDMVGRSCEVWGWGGDRNDYTCSHVFPSNMNAARAMTHTNNEIASCLTDWSTEKSHTARGTGDQIIFSSTDVSAKVALFLIPDPISKTRWTLHLLIGDTENY